MPAPRGIVIDDSTYDMLVRQAQHQHPKKVFGYLLGARRPDEIDDVVFFEENARNLPIWRQEFEAYGKYFVDHDDAGFVATPEESWRVQQEVWSRGATEVAVFHTHQRHPANFSQIDYDTHRRCFVDMWHIILSLRNVRYPRMRAFAVSADGVHELAVARRHCSRRSRGNTDVRDAFVRFATAGLTCLSRSEIEHLAAWTARVDDTAKDPEGLSEYRALREQRFRDLVAPTMTAFAGATFVMGTRREDCGHFCGETPSHRLRLSPFALSRVPVTNEMYAVFDQTHAYAPAESRWPVVDVSWEEAVLCALWFGCRLPTEAEWEYACGMGSRGQWAVAEERELARLAWFSDSSSGVLHDVASREPNRLGLYDLHGQVWEWCADDYDPSYYARSPGVDPLCIAPDGWGKVCRGGSIHALAEMCRTRYRQYEPPDFRASDLGFRLARTCNGGGQD